eukprot:1371130-Amorphochlora_amoeboformis.AAC.1
MQVFLTPMQLNPNLFTVDFPSLVLLTRANALLIRSSKSLVRALSVGMGSGLGFWNWGCCYA